MQDASQQPDPLLGRVFKESYRIDRLLADGGMSRVYIAEQISLARPVVVKMLLPSFHDEDFIQLFLREARICSQLNHPNIVSVLDFGYTEDGLVYLVMEYLEGAALADIVHQQGGLTLANVIWLMEPLCHAISAAHGQNVVHRDLKPGNVMVATLSGNDTTVKVVDFGISKPMDEDNLKHTQLGTVMGTPGYLAPEQIRGTDINHFADIYGIGAILHFMITGEAPYRGASREIIFNKQMKELPPPLSSYRLRDQACEIVQPVIYKAMALAREDRYGSVAELLREFLVCARQPLPVESLAQEEYQLVFKGETSGNHSVDQAKQRLHKALKFTDVQLNALFSGKRVVVKKNLKQIDAQRFQSLFDKCGAKAHIETMEDKTRVVSPSAIGANAAAHAGEAGKSEPISVAGFVQAGASPFASQDRSAATGTPYSTPSPYSLPAPSMSASAMSASAAAPNAAVQASQPVPGKSKLALLVGLIAAVVLAMVMLVVPSSRYGVSDQVMYGLGLAQPQRGILSDRIRLGMSAAFSGSARELGRSMRMGMEAYFKQLNENGGVNGRHIELYSLDDGYEPGRALANMENWLDANEGVFGLIGNVGTPTSKAILPSVLDNRLLMFGTFSGAGLLRNDPPDRYVFNYRASYAEETAAIVHYFVKVLEMNPKHIGVFYQNDSFGLDGLTGVANAVSQYGATIEDLSTATYERNSARVMDALALLRPNLQTLEGIVIVGTYHASARFTKLLQLNGYQGRIANVSFVGAAALAEELKESELNQGAGVIVSQVVPMYDSHASGVLEYQQAMARYYPSEPLGFVSLEGYVTAKLFSLALKKTGRYFSTEELIGVLESMDQVDLGIGRPVSFSASDHQGSHQVWGSVIGKDGTFNALDFEKIQLQ